MNRLLLTAFAVLPAFVQVVAEPFAITLEESINRAVSNNLSLASLEYSTASSRVILQSRLDRFRLNLTPEIRSERGEAGDTDSAKIVATKQTSIGTAISASAGGARSEPDDDAPFYRSSVSLQIQQPLLRNVGRQVNLEPVRDAERGVLNALREMAIRQTDLIVQVAESHETLLSIQRQLEFQKRTIERLLRLVKLTSAREKQGRATRVDTMRSDLRLGNARARLAALEERLINERASFAELLGEDPSSDFTAVPGDIPVFKIPEVDEAIECSLSNRLDLAQIIDDFEDARRGVLIARRNLLPDLTLIARYELSGEGDTFSASQKLEDDVWFVGFQLSSDVPLRDQRSALASAEITREVSGLKIESVKLAVKKQVRQSISSYERILTEKELAEKNYEIAKNRARLARKMFETGKGDSFSVSEAEDELLAAEEQLLASQAQASIASYKIKRVMGTLIDYPGELKPDKSI